MFPHVLCGSTSDQESLGSIILLSMFVLSPVSHVPRLQHCNLIKNTQQFLLQKHMLHSRRGPQFLSRCLWLLMCTANHITQTNLVAQLFLSQLLTSNSSKSYTNHLQGVFCRLFLDFSGSSSFPSHQLPAGFTRKNTVCARKHVTDCKKTSLAHKPEHGMRVKWGEVQSERSAAYPCCGNQDVWPDAACLDAKLDLLANLIFLV